MSFVLGIDPGLASTGFAVLAADGRLVECGTIKTQARFTPGSRLLEIVEKLDEVVRKHGVREAALEELFLGRNRTSFVGVAQARGAILAMLESHLMFTAEYKPSLVKSVVTGYGAADKRQMARMLGAQVVLRKPADDHALDAVAIALCHLRSRKLRVVAGT